MQTKTAAAKAWLKSHGIPVVVAFVLGALACHFGGPAAAAEPPPIETRIVHAIGVLDGNAEAFTKSGKPRVKAIERLLGTDISAAQRDAGWKAYRAGEKPAECPVCAEPDPNLQAKLDAAIEAFATASAEKADLRANLDATTAAAEKQRKRAEAAEAKIDSARDEAREARWQADARVREANARAAKATALAKAAESKTADAIAGRSVCAAERAVLAADKSWTAGSVREKARKLLDCLAVGE